MSVAGLRYALTVPQLNASERLLFIVLADRADKDGQCFPSQAWMAKKTDLSLRTVVRSLKSLEAKGHLARQRRSSVSGRSTDLLTLRLPSVGAKLARRLVPNVSTIPTSPYGVGKKEKKAEDKEGGSARMRLVHGGRS